MSQVNPQFAAAASALYAIAGFAPRAKGARRMADLMAYELFSPDSLPAGWQAELLGVSPGYGCHGEVILYNKWVVTGPCGTRVPAYSRYAPASSFVLCQDFNYVPAKG